MRTNDPFSVRNTTPAFNTTPRGSNEVCTAYTQADACAVHEIPAVGLQQDGPKLPAENSQHERTNSATPLVWYFNAVLSSLSF